MYNDNINVILFCEIIINRGVLIFVDFVVHVKSNEIQFSHRLLPIVLETTNSRTQESLYFVEITNTGVNEQKYFHSI
jgi:hypothetical protein